MVTLARRGLAVAAIVIAILAPTLLFYQPVAPSSHWRESIFGTMSELLGRFIQIRPHTQVRLVAIDNQTIKRTAPWPWTSERLAMLAEQVQENEPRLVLVNVRTPAKFEAVKSFSDARLDPRVKGSLGLLQPAGIAPRSGADAVLPLLTAKNDVVTPASVASDAMTILHINNLRIDGRRAGARWATTGPGVHALAPLNVKIGKWSTTPSAGLRVLGSEAPTGLRIVPAWRILAGDAATQSDLAGALVVVRRVDTTSPSGAAWRETQALAQLVNGMTPGRPDWALPAEIAAAALGGLIVSLLMLFGRIGRAIGAAVVVTLAFFVASEALFVVRLDLLDPVTPSLFVAGALAFSAIMFILRRSLGANAATPERNREVPVVLNGVERREVTALVCEIRDLSTLTETYRDSPLEMTRLVGKLLGTAADIVRAHRGTIENIGPARLYAVFNAPGLDSRHAEKAAEAALAVLGRLDPMNEALEKSLASTGIPFTPVNFSIGIDTGDAVVGDIGFKSRREFAAFGPALDSAAALAALSKTYGPAILVGDKTEALINRTFALLELDMREAADSDAHAFFALLGNPVLRANPRFKALQEGFRAFHTAYRRGSWDQAAELLVQCSKLPGVSPRLVALYEQRVEFLKRSPLGNDWGGVFRPLVE